MRGYVKDPHEVTLKYEPIGGKQHLTIKVYDSGEVTGESHYYPFTPTIRAVRDDREHCTTILLYLDPLFINVNWEGVRNGVFGREGTEE